MQIISVANQPSKKASNKWFTGVVWQDAIFEAPEPARVRVLRVNFEPGARTAWHTHPLGQTLQIIHGIGLIGVRGEKPRLMNTGDTVWIRPNEEHWHGATAENSMTHIAIQEALNGQVALWLELVSNEDYDIN